MGREAFKRIVVTVVAPIVLALSASAATARQPNPGDMPANDSQAKAAVNRAWAQVRSVSATTVADARGAAHGGVACSDDQVIDALVGANSFYRTVFHLDGNDWSLNVTSMSTGNVFRIYRGQRTCQNRGHAGCPASGIWGQRGFAIKLAAQGRTAR